MPGLRIAVVSVGRLGTGPVPDAIRGYETRAGRYWSLSTVEVRQASARSLAVDDVQSREWARVAAALPAGADVVVCDERGTAMSSAAFASWLSSPSRSSSGAAFAIGGAFGLPPAARSSATLVLALAGWTLPHDVARLVLAEQLYRAGTIVRGEPYHK